MYAESFIRLSLLIIFFSENNYLKAMLYEYINSLKYLLLMAIHDQKALPHEKWGPAILIYTGFFFFYHSIKNLGWDRRPDVSHGTEMRF